MKKAILLLHGFKRNDVDDFEEVNDYIKTLAEKIGAEKIHNEIWFENYNKETLNLKHFDKRAKEVAELINKENYDELIVIGYSTGTIFSANVMKHLTVPSVKFYGACPAFKAHILKWRKTLQTMKQVEKDLRAKLGTERYERLKKAKQDQQVSEKYPVLIIFFMFRKVIGKRKKPLQKIKNAHFLIAEDDHIVKTGVAVKTLSKNGTNHITIKDFTHDLIIRKDKQIFIDWLEEVVK